MIVKPYKPCVAFSLLFLFSRTGFAGDMATDWDYSPVGECIKNYKAPKSTSENPFTIQAVKNRDAHGNSYIWIWDPTPEKNPTRQLVRISPKKLGCIVLFMPFSEFNDFKLGPGGELPMKVTSTSATVNLEQGSYYIEQEYFLDNRTGFYQKMPTCYKVKTGSAGREKVACETAFDG